MFQDNVTKVQNGLSMTIGERIKNLRKNLNVTAKDFADVLQIPLRTIGSYERNEAQPSPKFFNALIDIYHVNINWLLTGEGNLFLSQKTEVDMAFISLLKSRFNLTDEEINGLIDILDSDASKDMVLKFISIKNGDKVALDTLIYNLQGIKAIYT